jgi:signal peptidase I
MNDFFEIDDPEPPRWEEERPPARSEQPLPPPAAPADPSAETPANPWAAASSTPPPAAGPSYEPYDPYADPEPAEDEEEFHSRNPIDRATRRLPHGWRVTIDWVLTIVGAVAIVLAIKAWVVNPYRIPTPSMEPTLHCARSAAEPSCRGRFSDRVLANRFIYHFRSPHRGEIVVFKAPEKAKTACSSGEGDVFVKRIVGMPGDVVTERDGWIYINGKKLEEPYLAPEVHTEDRTNSFHGPVTIPKDSYEMMGDNRSESCDSRTWGPVPRKNIIGKVFMTYWPPNRISLH